MPVRKTITVSITPEQDALIRDRLNCGRFGSVSDVVAAALHLLDREAAVPPEPITRLEARGLTETTPVPAFLQDGGNMGACMRSHDWTGTPLGPPQLWPATLRTSVSNMLVGGFASFIAWGPERTLFYNDAYSEILSAKHPWALGQPFSEVWSEAWDDIAPLYRRTAVDGEAFQMADLPLRLQRNGQMTDCWFTFSYAPIRDDDGVIRGLLCNCIDTTIGVIAAKRRDAAEAELRQINATLERQVAERTAALKLYADIVQASAAPICAFDRDYRLIAFNQAHNDEFFRVNGFYTKIGDVFPELFVPEQRPLMRGLMTRALTGEVFHTTEEFGKPELGKPFWELSYSPLRDETGRVIGAFHYAKDISERLRAEAELAVTQEALRQSQKMEAVGQLTGGLAHDFNNLLTGISGSLELMISRMRQGRYNDIERFVMAAQGAAKRAAALTHRLLAFSRRQTLDPKPTDVNRLVIGMQEMIQRTVGPAIPVEVVCAAGLWPALVDPPQLESALLNLCINARDAMPDGGRITIETANKWFEARVARQQDIPEGQYLAMSVTDTGTGMSPEVVARVFEPFFTTKPTGEGTGLGLSMIYGFTRQSGGQVRIYSEIGKGTTVSIYLPRYHGAVFDDEIAAKLEALPQSGRGATVLIVDDEPTVRMLVVDILEDLGCTVIEAGESMAGLKILQSDARIDLLVTDVGLPGGMNGRQMADAARVRRPDLKVLFITGYAENAALGNGQLAPGMAVLTKPFAIETMAARIRSLIEGDMEAHRHSSIAGGG